MARKEHPTTKICKYCMTEIPYDAKVCPQCRKKQKRGALKWVIIAAAVLLLIGMISNGKKSAQAPVAPAPAASQATAAEVKSTPDETQDADRSLSEPAEEEKAVPAPEQTEADTPEPEEDVPSVPGEYLAALKKAESYSSIMNMSKAGIFDQLTSEYGENFTAEAAQYAVDNLNVDYRENALKKAESYSDTMHMSKAGIYDQLTSEYGEKFTAEEAQYAVDNLKTDYRENALAKAKEYQELMSMSNSAIYDQLTSEYGEKFTAEEAQYAVDHLN